MRTGFVILLALCLAVLGIGSSRNTVQSQIASPDFPNGNAAHASITGEVSTGRVYAEGASYYHVAPLAPAERHAAAGGSGQRRSRAAPERDMGSNVGSNLVPSVTHTCDVKGNPTAFRPYKEGGGKIGTFSIELAQVVAFYVSSTVANNSSDRLDNLYVKFQFSHVNRGILATVLAPMSGLQDEDDETNADEEELRERLEPWDAEPGAERTFKVPVATTFPGDGWILKCTVMQRGGGFLDSGLGASHQELTEPLETPFSIDEVPNHETIRQDSDPYTFEQCQATVHGSDITFSLEITGSLQPGTSSTLHGYVRIYQDGAIYDSNGDIAAENTTSHKGISLIYVRYDKLSTHHLDSETVDISDWADGDYTFDCVMTVDNFGKKLANSVKLVHSCQAYHQSALIAACLVNISIVYSDHEYPLFIRSCTFSVSDGVATSACGEPDGVIVPPDPRWGKLIIDPPLLGHQGGDATVRVYTLEPTNPEYAISAPAIYAVIPEEIVVPGASDQWDGSVAPCETAAVVGPDYTEYCWQATFEGVPQNASFDTDADGVVVFKELAYAVKVASDRITGAAPESLFRVAGRSPFSSDRALLEALYDATGGENWHSETAADRDTTKAWLTLRDVGDWYGVTVDGGQRVTRLELGRNYLKGGLPDELGYLEHLEHLDLHANNLVKAGIEFGNDWTGLSGSIPRSLGRLGQLTLLDLSFNSLGGAIPIELASLKSLDTLDLSGNRLSGEIPPELGALKGLEILDLSDNRLSGEIPAELTLLTNLRYLGLSDNRFTGCIPAALRNVPSSDLDDLDIPYCEDAPSEMASFAHNTALDFDGLSDAGNDYPNGIWSDGTTLWVADVGVEKLYAYDLATGARIPSKELDTLESAGNTNPRGIWSDGTTIWVTDYSDDKIYAYNLVTGARIEGQDFNTLDGAGNNKPLGLWSYGATMWVADSGEEKLFAYDLTTKARIPSKDFDTLEGADNQSPEGLWSDGTTMWVSDYTEEKIYAYDLATTLRVPSKDYDALSAAGNTDPVGIWSDGKTMWVADETGAKIYAYGTASPLGRPAGLTATTGAESGEVVLRWTPAAAATVHWIYFQKADGTGGHWPTALAGDATTATITGLDVGQEYEFWVRAGQEQAAGTTHRSEWSNAAQATSGGVVATSDDGAFARNFGQDFAFGGSNLPRGVWSDGTTMWVADGADRKIYAYDLASQARDHGKDFNALRDALNHDLRGIWSDGTTMWVTDQDRGRIYAYDLLSTERDDGKDFNTLETAGNSSPVGIWSDGATMWVADQNSGKIYAYNLASKAREPNKDFDTLEAAGNDDPQGLWSDGTTMWVVDEADAKVYAYDLASKVQEPSRDFNTLLDAFNHEPRGLWSDGMTMWVADEANDKIYAYHLASKARDSSGDLHNLRGALPRYAQDIWSDGTTMWVADEADHKLYAYDLASKAREASKDFNTLLDAGNRYPSSIWSDGTTMWVADQLHGKIYAYDMVNKTRDTSKDFNTPSASRHSNLTGIWSNGTTMWLTHTTGDKLYAYDLASKARDVSKDFGAPDAAARSPQGFWSDGTTMWIADRSAVIYAYDLDNQVRDPSKDFNTLRAAGNRNPRGLWSDGTTMWVQDEADDKIYAYDLVSKAREPGSDFGVLRGNGDHDPRGIWSDGTTMWVADHFDYWIYAYDLVSKARDPSRDLYNLPVLEYGIWSDGTTMWVTEWHNNGKISAYDLASKALDPSKDFNTLDAAGNNNPRGLWSDGTTMWVTDHQIGGTIYAYDLASKARDPSKDFNTHLGDGHDDPVALWSDRVTMWVADAREDKIFAYDLASKARDASKDFNTLDAAGNNHPRDIWSDGTTMWVTDASDRKIYAYNMPGGAQTSDRALLVALYNATGGPNWTNNANWLSSEPLNEWHGVNTDDSGHVNGLELHNNQLMGSIPSALGNLSDLEQLRLNDNQLTGGIPASLGSLSNLTRLDLDDNQLVGEIPQELGNLSNLTHLDLNDNQLTGSIPTWLSNFSNLEFLNLGGNQFTGPVPAWLSNLSNFEVVSLWGNQLTGSIPAQLANLSNLEVLSLGGNQFIGEIPSQLGNLSNLTWLDLDDNQLVGEIPQELGNLSNLTHLDLNDNQLTGSIPTWLSNFSNLEFLNLGGNQFTGPVPAWLGNLSNLEVLSLWRNQLTGSIPPQLGNLSNLEVLSLGGNQFTGEIPSRLGNLSNLMFLRLWGNQLTGAIPATFGGLSSLEELSLSGNQLSGTLPSALGNLANLTGLYLWQNQLTGPIPASLGDLTKLEVLHFQENQLSGEIPTSLGNLANLTHIDLDHNQFTGEIPTSLGNLANLTKFDLSNNRLSGGVPVWLGGLTNLTYLDLDVNQLTGEIPRQLGNLVKLEHLDLDHNMLTGQIPEELTSLANLAYLYLAGNQLTGCIPVGLQDVPSNDFGALGLPFCAATGVGTGASGEVPTDQTVATIVFGYPSWESVQLQTRIAQYIVEKGYSYHTDVIHGDTAPLISALRSGDVDVLMEFWLPRQQEAWSAIQQDGSALSLGESLGPHWQSAFVIPAYLQEQYPALDNVEDLKNVRYRSLFDTATSGGKARLISCVRGWECEIDNAAQVEGYGLSDHVEIFNPASGSALDADLLDAYDNREPWLGFQWGTSGPALRLDLVRLNEPPYSDECWSTTKACAYEDSTILIASNPDLPNSAPDVTAMLRKWDFGIDTVYKDIARWRFDNPNADIDAAALWWLNNRSSVWGQWVTDTAAASILAASGAGEIPVGWQ